MAARVGYDNESDVRYCYRPNEEDEEEYGLMYTDMKGGGSQRFIDTQSSAKLAEAAYIYGGSGGTSSEREANTNKAVASLGFKILPHYSGRQMSVFQKQTPNGLHVHIAHKGTQPNTLHGLRDIVSDVRIAIGTTMFDSQFNKRIRLSERAVKDLNPAILTMSGHSLGGATMNDTIVRSKLLRKRVNQADSFDAGANPFTSGMNKRLKTSEKERLDDVMTHHRMKHDLVSKGLLYAKPPGDVVTYKLAQEKDETWNDEPHTNGEENTGHDDPLPAGAIKKLDVASKGLYAHHIDHFSERDNLNPSFTS